MDEQEEVILMVFVDFRRRYPVDFHAGNRVVFHCHPKRFGEGMGHFRALLVTLSDPGFPFFIGVQSGRLHGATSGVGVCNKVSRKTSLASKAAGAGTVRGPDLPGGLFGEERYTAGPADHRRDKQRGFFQLLLY